MVTNDLMEARYGKMRKAGRDRQLVLVFGSVLAAALLVFIGYSVFGKPTEITGAATDIVVNADRTVTAKVTFTNPTGKAATCQLSALNKPGFSVGSIQVKVPADKLSAQQLSILTVETADALVVVDSCWAK